jgi:hypothetical protein
MICGMDDMNSMGSKRGIQMDLVLFIYLFIYLFVCLFIYLFVCLFVCLFREKFYVIKDGEQTTTSKGIKPRETRDLTWKTPSTREGKTTGASQQQFTMSGVRLQRQRRRLTRRE